MSDSQASDQTPEEPQLPDEEEMPTSDEMTEPSTEKDPDEEPTAPTRDEPEPSHEAVGIGIIGRPQVAPDEAESSE